MATEQRTLVVNDGKWTDSYELTQPSGTTITFNTSTQYVDKPIKLNSNEEDSISSPAGTFCKSGKCSIGFEWFVR